MHRLTYLVAMAVAQAVVFLAGCQPIPDDPFFQLSPGAQNAALRSEYSPERAVDLYLQAGEYYHPHPGRLSRALASRGESIVPTLRCHLASRPPYPEGYLIVHVLWKMDAEGYYAVSGDPELIRLAEAAVGSDPRALSLLNRIRKGVR